MARALGFAADAKPARASWADQMTGKKRPLRRYYFRLKKRMSQIYLHLSLHIYHLRLAEEIN
jgi:hypothetical protein